MKMKIKKNIGIVLLILCAVLQLPYIQTLSGYITKTGPNSDMLMDLLMATLIYEIIPVIMCVCAIRLIRGAREPDGKKAGTTYQAAAKTWPADTAGGKAAVPASGTKPKAAKAPDLNLMTGTKPPTLISSAQFNQDKSKSQDSGMSTESLDMEYASEHYSWICPRCETLNSNSSPCCAVCGCPASRKK